MTPLVEMKDISIAFGGVQAVLFDRNQKVLFGGADPRRDGRVVAY